MRIIRLLFTKYFVSFLLVAFYLTEAINKIIIYEFYSKSDIPAVTKFTVLVILTCFIVFYQIKSSLHIFLIAGLFIIGQLFLSPSFNSIVLINFVKYLFPLVLLIYFSRSKIDNLNINVALTTFEWLILVNSCLIIIGFIFNVFVFKTYKGGRFGYSGLLITSSTSTYVYVVSLTYFFIKYKTRLFFHLKPIIVLVSMILIGTKSIFLFLFLLIIYSFLISKNKRYKYSVLSVIIGAPLVAYYLVFHTSNFFNNFLQNDGIVTMLFSFRNELLFEGMMPHIKSNWNFVNYCCGGINDIKTRAQMSYFDLFLFFGAFGAIVYLYTFVKNLFLFNKSNNEIFVISSLFLISFLSGNFFLNASVAIYLVIIKIVLVFDQKDGFIKYQK